MLGTDWVTDMPYSVYGPDLDEMLRHMNKGIYSFPKVRTL